MKSFSYEHLLDRPLLQVLDAVEQREGNAIADLVAVLAEVDARRLYLPAGYPSMHRYCVDARGHAEDAAFRRIRTARTARKYPVIFHDLAERRLNMSGVLLLAPHLTPETASELLSAAYRKTNAVIELMLAGRFPKPDVPTRIEAITVEATRDELALTPVAEMSAQPSELALTPVAPMIPQALAAPPIHRAKLSPLTPERFALQVTVGKETHDLLKQAQELSGQRDVGEILLNAMRDYTAKLKKRKFGAGSQSRPRRGAKPNARRIPAAVRKAVWERDRGQCTFVADNGHRCESREHLQFDHVIPVARGGQPTIDELRLLCGAHNQHAAERTFGTGFMKDKRETARHKFTPHPDVIAALRRHEFRGAELRAAMKICEAKRDRPIEEQVRYVLGRFSPTPAEGRPA